MDGFGFVVKTGDGHLLIRRLQPAGKGQMEAEDFLRGNPLRIRQRLSDVTPRGEDD